MDLDLDLGADLKADKMLGVTHISAPDAAACWLAVPYDALPGPSTNPPVAPSTFPDWVAMLGRDCCRGAADSWPPPSGTLSLAHAHVPTLPMPLVLFLPIPLPLPPPRAPLPQQCEGLAGGGVGDCDKVPVAECLLHNIA